MLMPSDSEQPQPLLPNAQIHQQVVGDHNQVIGQVFGGTVIHTVENLTQVLQNPAPALSLHQLPPDIADFVGRETELSQVKAQLQPTELGSSVVISAVAGMAGVGKSALAIHVAHQI